MRDIKFRAKDSVGVWVYGDLRLTSREPHIWTDPYTSHIINTETIGQYTGFKDMNDKEIYEGDIIRDFHSFYFSGDFTKKIRGAYAVTQDKDEPIPVVSYCRNYAVEWSKRGSYILRNGSDQHPLCTRFRGVEVIGNVHDNPELMER